MTLRTISRTSGALAALIALVATVLTFAAPGASGLEQPRVTLVPNQKLVNDYFPLIGNNPGATVDASTTVSTDICSKATACDVIPLTVPDPKDEDDFFVTITLNWDTAEVPNVPVLGDTAVNDLDLWIVDDPFNENAGPDEDGFHYKSAGTDEPEIVQMYRPIGNFNIIVVNATGVNTGYRLTFNWTTDRPPTIFESLPPAFTGGGTRPAPAATPAKPVTPLAAPVAPIVEDDAAPLLPSVPVTAAQAPRPDLSAGVTATPDSSFSSGFGDAPSLDQELAGPAAQPFVPAAVVKPKAPSNLTLLLWLLFLPLALLAIAAAVLNRRRSSMLQI
jgi:hypothetical protein